MRLCISGCFRPRLEILEMLCGQIIISLSNARFHSLQMDLLQAKVNPHFLFNALSSIAHLTLQDPSGAEAAVLKLSKLYRYVLTSASSTLVELEKELEIVRAYLVLEKIRFGAKLDFSIAAEGDISRVKLPGMLIQPLVENSIRHGISQKIGPGKVSVQVRVEGARCRISVQDNGDEGSKSMGGTGFGMKSVQERLKLVYGDDYTFGISRSMGYRVEIGIPIREAI